MVPVPAIPENDFIQAMIQKTTETPDEPAQVEAPRKLSKKEQKKQDWAAKEAKLRSESVLGDEAGEGESSSSVTSQPRKQSREDEMKKRLQVESERKGSQ